MVRDDEEEDECDVTILTIEIFILVFVRARREKKFSLYVEALETIVGFFFAFVKMDFCPYM